MVPDFGLEQAGGTRRGTLVLVALGTLLLAGCASTPAANDLDEMVTSNVDRTSVPGFADEAQSEDDVLSNVDLAKTAIDPASTRYQGSWEGWDVYLGISGDYTVNFITVGPEDHQIVSSGHSIGNSVIAMGDPISLQYLPQGTADVPEGWHALTEWIIVRD